MPITQLDTKGMRCPQPVLKVAAKLPDMKAGDILEVTGDCPTFEDDLKKWCERMKKTLVTVSKDGNTIVAQIHF